MSKIEYYHQPALTTVAVEVPADHLLYGYLTAWLRAGKDKPKLLLKVGVSKCNPRDTFSKAEGRRVSSSNMFTRDMELTAFNFTDGQGVLTFTDAGLELDLLYRGNDKRAFFIYAHITT